MEMMTTTVKEFEQQGDRLKDIVVAALMRDGLLGRGGGIKWAKTHVVVVRRRSTISGWLRRFVGKEAEPYTIMIAALPLGTVGEEEEDEQGA